MPYGFRLFIHFTLLRPSLALFAPLSLSRIYFSLGILFCGEAENINKLIIISLIITNYRNIFL